MSTKIPLLKQSQFWWVQHEYLALMLAQGLAVMFLCITRYQIILFFKVRRIWLKSMMILMIYVLIFPFVMCDVSGILLLWYIHIVNTESQDNFSATKIQGPTNSRANISSSAHPMAYKIDQLLSDMARNHSTKQQGEAVIQLTNK